MSHGHVLYLFWFFVSAQCFLKIEVIAKLGLVTYEWKTQISGLYRTEVFFLFYVKEKSKDRQFKVVTPESAGTLTPVFLPHHS